MVEILGIPVVTIYQEQSVGREEEGGGEGEGHGGGELYMEIVPSMITRPEQFNNTNSENFSLVIPVWEPPVRPPADRRLAIRRLVIGDEYRRQPASIHESTHPRLVPKLGQIAGRSADEEAVANRKAARVHVRPLAHCKGWRPRHHRVGPQREQKLLVAVDVAKLLARLQRQLGEGFAHVHTRIVAARESPVAKDARLLDERRVRSLFVTSEHAVYANHQ